MFMLLDYFAFYFRASFIGDFFFVEVVIEL